MNSKPFLKGTLIIATFNASWCSSHDNKPGNSQVLQVGEIMIALGERWMPDTTWKWHQGMEHQGMELVQHPKWGPGWVYREALSPLPKNRKKSD
jgi:hypothetical protein